MKRINEAAVSYHHELVAMLRNDEELQIEYLRASFEDNSDMPTAILSAIRTVAEARGFKNFAESAGLNRENLYRVLSEDGNPRLDTFFKILDALDLRISVVPKNQSA